MNYKFVLVLALIISMEGCCNRKSLTMSDNAGNNENNFKIYANDVHSIYFGFNKANIEGQSIAKVNELVQQLKKVRHVKLVLYGYTDRLGQGTYNHNLAMRRIHSVKKLLIQNGVIKTNDILIEAKAIGENDPLISYDTINNSPKSRRVDICITRR
jgi:outer membrane protein OmpA-like peptidoglycan-associated protein